MGVDYENIMQDQSNATLFPLGTVQVHNCQSVQEWIFRCKWMGAGGGDCDDWLPQGMSFDCPLSSTPPGRGKTVRQELLLVSQQPKYSSWSLQKGHGKSPSSFPLPISKYFLFLSIYKSLLTVTKLTGLGCTQVTWMRLPLLETSRTMRNPVSDTEAEEFPEETKGGE